MRRPMSVTTSVVVAAPPEQLWPLVSDPAQTPRWSPENTGAVLPSAGTPDLGTSFVGANRRAGVRWQTACVVTAVEPQRRFAFQVRRWGLSSPWLRVAIASWEYRLEPVAGGTRVSLTWTDDRRWPDPVANVADRLLTRGSTFADFQLRNTRTSLQRLRALVEGDAA
ncbi:SRPBCC family protein [Modestobacter sp. I12A-02628]|uniref:SRPBCC family protein n=1 Tax=Goekera deserti TaxID=2497753 RepID=A0A7K3WHI7_9ACTN|nr:SRPBCC family protein [Goekera deserti]MPQ99090.1 SRPBCC family protein [Goekera deserti]NDI47424.1 SRPBCC family protein [Goekera deserti]NEL55955.1 SRPBCC family protein [Goekera deserti]